MSQHEVKNIVRKYAQQLKKKRIPFRRVYLFGSHAMGKAKTWSDIDVAVVVKTAGSSSTYFARRARLWQITPDVDTRIEPILLEEREFKRGEESLMAAEIKKHGILVR